MSNSFDIYKVDVHKISGTNGRQKWAQMHRLKRTTNWKEIAEITALVAVIASLIVVAMELRQTQVALVAQAYQARSFQAFDFQLYMAERPGFDELFGKSAAPDFEIEDLSPMERMTLLRLYYALRMDVDNEHYQYQMGFLDEGFYLATTARDIKTYAPIWRMLGVSSTRPEFKAEVDRILDDDTVQSWLGESELD